MCVKGENPWKVRLGVAKNCEKSDTTRMHAAKKYNFRKERNRVNDLFNSLGFLRRGLHFPWWDFGFHCTVLMAVYWGKHLFHFLLGVQTVGHLIANIFVNILYFIFFREITKQMVELFSGRSYPVTLLFDEKVMRTCLICCLCNHYYY